ncbi:hypothetical protein [Helicobacter macacae]|uniref:Protein hydE n=1 Tax=Helicobacter macacae MIT 99-5501 TaxID=1357400 RepID=V8C5Q5_9HELI|nr:hypothetical protein [Helicobacter macacae]ETD22738.1 hypothetical protein HMPREF2086_01537 [Helicobacter macacae MIT 99-5501]
MSKKIETHKKNTSKDSNCSLDSTFAFIFLSTKSHKAIAPFEAILCDLAKKHRLDFGSEFCPSKEWIKPSELYFFVRPINDAKANDGVANDTIIAFANSISENLPLSMDFVFKGIESAKSLQESSILPKKISYAKILHSKTPHDRTLPKNAESIPTVQEMKALLGAFEEKNEDNTASDLSLCSVLKPFFVDIRYGDEVFDTKSAKKIAPKDSSLAVLLARLASKLAEGKPVRIRTKRGDMTLSVGEKSPLVMFWELGALQSFMRVNQAQISLLGSFEKPSMKLCPKEVFAKEFFGKQNQVAQSAGMANPVEIECVLAYEPLLALLGVYARARGVEFVFVKPFDKKSSEILESALTYTIPPYKRVSCDKNGTYVEDRFCKLNLFSLIRKHYVSSTPSLSLQNTAKIANASQMLVCYLSKSKNTAIWVYRQVPNDNQQAPQNQARKDTFSEILHIDFSLNPTHALAEIATRENGDKLIANFTSHFGEHSLDFSLEDSTKATFAKELEKSCKNLIEFFSVIAKVLRLCPKDASVEEGVNSVLNKAKLFLRDKGPRIDYKTVKSPQGGLALDMPRILRSAMSFSLAGVDSATLCYGVVDSLCEFVGNLARDMGQNYAIKKVFLCGDMLTESIFLDKILHYLPKDMEIILPQDGFVDFYK